MDRITWINCFNYQNFGEIFVWNKILNNKKISLSLFCINFLELLINKKKLVGQFQDTTNRQKIENSVCLTRHVGGLLGCSIVRARHDDVFECWAPVFLTHCLGGEVLVGARAVYQLEISRVDNAAKENEIFFYLKICNGFKSITK